MYLLKPVMFAVTLHSVTFTFHYVSIKTFIRPPAPAMALIFTFHYVSIKTRGLK